MSNKNTYWAILGTVISIGALGWLNGYLKFKQEQNLQEEFKQKESAELIHTLKQTRDEVSKTLNQATNEIVWDVRDVVKDNRELIDPLVKKDEKENKPIVPTKEDLEKVDKEYDFEIKYDEQGRPAELKITPKNK